MMNTDRLIVVIGAALLFTVVVVWLFRGMSTLDERREVPAILSGVQPRPIVI
jgi:hypothetical protein